MNALKANIPRVFVAPEQIKDGLVSITGTETGHLSRVLRLGAGDVINILDGRGKSYEAAIEILRKGEIVCRITAELPAPAAPPLRVTLAQGLPKGDKMDFIIQKGTELGVSRVIPLMCRRTVVRLEGGSGDKKRERWQRIACEAASQCGRPDIPVVDGPMDWGRALAGLPEHTPALIPWEEEHNLSLKDFLREHNISKEIYVFIGPEGGFDREEVELAMEHGIRPVTLGPRILRTETAGLAVLTMILYQWGDLGGE
ncbi:16S rRNA (uracil(1498)-N(3))-methyltransferase [Pelotomaculum propionicicum]|uniref:Ribosomal RNA small subunit methyltransferase E n=1 Tax=Pelotomaculum propionicicum TaxID=258475 RepID=A0A4Y7RS37_9FIRM|nr:16S rRNA (uracil(1498)-N(3))-methyltransferase [Pelotomaculum propionicicum]NLI12991.1 16S rRNA (uracil(1498)-N(3))-methyltransferase [Peptococcaceae bacterium]TEB11529.1 Ribosomal RNA small subunit methyltransferase E [Pelotomaculum propionicicum]